MINFIYRQRGRRYSIENVFNQVFDELCGKHVCKKTFVGYHRANACSILKNIAHVRLNQSELNHVTGDITYTTLGLESRYINIVTIHDLVTLRELEGWKRHVAKELWFALPMRRATAVTTISTEIAKEILALYPDVEDKLHVIHNPVSRLFVHTVKPDLSPKPRILHVGTKANKNLSRVVDALQGLDVELVILGALDEGDRLQLMRRGIDFANPCNLSLSEVVREYAQSDLVVFPSLYEGFGLPIAEANAVGRPVITSRQQPMMEIAADAALFVDPLSVSEIRGAVVSLLGDAARRVTLVRKGLGNARRFRPSRIADAYLHLYESCGYAAVEP